MSLSISNKLITNIDDCIGKPLLTYVFYPSDESTRCFAYPQFLYDDDKNEIVSISSKDAFPEEGGLSVGIGTKNSITNSKELQNRYGDIVLMTINEVPQSNINYGKEYGKGKDKDRHKYHTSILPGKVKGSYAHFQTISRHSLSFQLFQVLNVEERLNFSKPAELWSVHMYEGDVLPLTHLVLLEQESEANQKFIGPFQCSKAAEASQEIKLQASATEPYSCYIAPINSSSVKQELEITSEHGDVIAKFVLADEFQLLFESSKQKIDCVSNEELFTAIGRIAKEADGYSKTQTRKLKQAIRTCQNVQLDIQLTDARRKQMENLLSTLEYWRKLPSETQRIAFNNAEPTELADFVLNNEEVFDGFYEKAAQASGIQSNVDAIEAESRLRIDDATAAVNLAEKEKELALKQLEDLKQKASEERKKLEAEIEEQNKAATQEKKQLEQDIEKLTSSKQKLESDNALIEEQINSKINDMSDELFVSGKIIESELIKKLVSSLSDNNSAANSAALDTKTASVPDVNNSISEEELIGQLCANVSELGGRDLELNDVVNLMICLTQGYILTLAGLPGTGKTSLVSILAGCLGLQNCNRFAEVSVERGWTSYKDFIGYYNPLTKTMEKSNPDVFDAFEMLNGEVDANVKLSETAPYFVLLDEANLSSIEHYWSPFLKECDSFQNRNTSISLGGVNSMSLPSYLRFIATVNFDHTTEELSPRFLDRSWVITLQANELDFQFDSAASNEPDYEKVPVYSVEKLQQVFGTSKNKKITSKLDDKYHELLGICEKHSFSVSPRSQKMMYNFISTAQRLMSCSSKDTEYAPVDYAFAQKVLPQISGAEEQVEGLLDSLSMVSGLPTTKERVNHMLEAGRDSGFYQYFA